MENLQTNDAIATDNLEVWVLFYSLSFACTFQQLCGIGFSDIGLSFFHNGFYSSWLLISDMWVLFFSLINTYKWNRPSQKVF